MKEASPLTIRDVAEVTGGLTKNARRDALPMRRPYLTVANVYANRLELEDVRSIGMEQSELARVELRPGDLLVVEGNGSLSQLGRVAVWTGAIPGCVHQNHLIKVRPKEGVTAKWLLYWLLSPDGRSAIEAVGSSTSGLHTLSISKVEGLPTRLCPLHVQHRIVAAIETHFSRLDAAAASLTRAKANVKRARASVLKAAVEGRLVPTEAALASAEGRDYEPASVLLKRILAERKAAWAASGRGGVYAEPVRPDTERLPFPPEGWALASLDELCSRITSGSRDWSRYYGRGTAVFLLAQNVRRRRLDLEVVQRVDPPKDDPACARSEVREGDLLVTIVGANTGEACRVPGELPRHFVCQSVALLRPVHVGVSRFVEAWLDSDPLIKVWERYAYGQGRPHLGFDDLRRTAVLLPPLPEQHRIVAEVDRRLSVLDALAASIDTNLARCARLRQAILKRAFEGRLVPCDPSPAVTAPKVKDFTLADGRVDE